MEAFYINLALSHKVLIISCFIGLTAFTNYARFSLVDPPLLRRAEDNVTDTCLLHLSWRRKYYLMLLSSTCVFPNLLASDLKRSLTSCTMWTIQPTES